MMTDSSGYRVLFVDDDQEVCDFLATFCDALQLDHSSARSAKEALNLCAEARFKLIITDLKMAEIDGVEFACKIKEKYPETGIFAFTGGASEYSQKTLEQLFDRIYYKPSDYSRMIGEAMKYLAICKYPGLA